jgi:hypothetical protein
MSLSKFFIWQLRATSWLRMTVYCFSGLWLMAQPRLFSDYAIRELVATRGEANLIGLLSICFFRLCVWEYCIVLMLIAAWRSLTREAPFLNKAGRILLLLLGAGCLLWVGYKFAHPPKITRN